MIIKATSWNIKWLYNKWGFINDAGLKCFGCITKGATLQENTVQINVTKTTVILKRNLNVNYSLFCIHCPHRKSFGFLVITIRPIYTDEN